MADNLCGPSNGAKNLLSHVDRNRSLQQERMVNSINGIHGAAGGPSTFRSQMGRANNGSDQDFAGFQQNGNTEPTISGAPGVVTLSHFRFHGPASHHGDFGINKLGGGPGHVAPSDSLINFPITPHISNYQPTPAAQDWISQFSNMNVSDRATPTPVVGAATRPQAPVHTYGGHDNLTFGFGHSGFASPLGAHHPGMAQMQIHRPNHANVVYGNQHQNFAELRQSESALDVDAFNKAFGDYDKAEFDAEIASWVEKETLGPPTPALPAEVEAKPQQEDTKQEGASAVRRREDEELARAAISILSSVSENSSEKFKNSNFFDLMRRIGNREVVVEGTNLVDATTGATVMPKADESAAGAEGAKKGMPTTTEASADEAPTRIHGA